MWQALQSMPVEKFVPGLAIGGFLLVAAIAVIAKAWRLVRRSEIEADLKREMLARGMSADEIVRVLEAGTSDTLTQRVRSIRRMAAALKGQPDPRDGG